MASEDKVKQIWKKYFEKLSNVEDGRGTVISTVRMRGSKIELGKKDENVVKEEV